MSRRASKPRQFSKVNFEGGNIRASMVIPPTLHINVSGSAIAWYGAVLSTITAIVQVMNHFRDRAKVVLEVRKNMRTPDTFRHRDMTMVIITATNAGRRPVTIAGFSVHLLFGKGKEKVTDWFLPDVRPPLPFEITEGKMVSAFLNQANVDFDAIAYWYVWDSVGRRYRLSAAPWYKQWLSAWRWRRSLKKA